jgi:RimJ/RimL family protein N-acetyltransferase
MHKEIEENIVSEYNNRVLLPLERKYLKKLMDFRNQQMEILRQNKLLTEKDQEKWFEKISQDKTQLMFEILLKDEYTFVGCCGLTYIDYDNCRGELSFIVDPKRAENEEIYKEDFIAVLTMLCKYGFEKIKLKKIFTETYDFRKKHIEILESFGLKYEGKMRKHVLINGKHHDSLLHSILCEEWKDMEE